MKKRLFYFLSIFFLSNKFTFIKNETCIQFSLITCRCIKLGMLVIWAHFNYKNLTVVMKNFKISIIKRIFDLKNLIFP